MNGHYHSYTSAYNVSSIIYSIQKSKNVPMKSLDPTPNSRNPRRSRACTVEGRYIWNSFAVAIQTSIWIKSKACVPTKRLPRFLKIILASFPHFPVLWFRHRFFCVASSNGKHGKEKERRNFLAGFRSRRRKCWRCSRGRRSIATIPFRKLERI